MANNGKGRFVDAAIGCLRRKHDRDQERERIHEIEFAFRIRACGRKTAENLGNARRIARFRPRFPAVSPRICVLLAKGPPR